MFFVKHYQHQNVDIICFIVECKNKADKLSIRHEVCQLVSENKG